MSNTDDAKNTMKKSNYTGEYDTWWMSEKQCNKCGSNMWTNNRIYDCTDCEQWDVIK